MKINLRYIKDKDLFELQLVESHLRSHFIVNRKLINELRSLIERALIETRQKDKR
ncbi:MAG: hypothetical protein ABIJ27_02725 [Candidatus Omnitrophota bacterium]